METPLPNDSSKASLSPPVGGCLRSFRRDWLTNKCSQNVLNIITNGYVLPFRSKPNLIRFPLILSEYKAQQKDQALATCIQSLLSKNAIERVENVKSLGFYSRLFLVPKPHQRWSPVIDLSRLNTFLHVEKFKMETPESIRTSLIPGEWVSSIDLSGAYLHIPRWRYPQSLDNLLPWTEAIAAHLDWWQNPSNVMKGADLHPKDHSIQLFTDASNEGWGAHLDQNSTKGLWSDREKRLHINVLELKAVSLALRDCKDQCLRLSFTR